MKSILDKSFRYNDSASTNLRATFARVRKQMKDEAEARAVAEMEAARKIKPIRSKS